MKAKPPKRRKTYVCQLNISRQLGTTGNRRVALTRRSLPPQSVRFSTCTLAVFVPPSFSSPGGKTRFARKLPGNECDSLAKIPLLDTQRQKKCYTPTGFIYWQNLSSRTTQRVYKWHETPNALLSRVQHHVRQWLLSVLLTACCTRFFFFQILKAIKMPTVEMIYWLL